MNIKKITGLILGIIMILSMISVPAFATEREVLINKTGPEIGTYLAKEGTDATYSYTYPTGAKLDIKRGPGYYDNRNPVTVWGAEYDGAYTLHCQVNSSGGWGAGIDYVFSVGERNVTNATIDFSAQFKQLQTSDFHAKFKFYGYNGEYVCLNLENATYYNSGATPATVDATIENKDGVATVNVTLTYFTDSSKTSTQTVTDTKIYSDIITGAGIYVDGYNNRLAYLNNVVLGVTQAEEVEEGLPDDTVDEGDYLYAPEQILVNNALPVTDATATKPLIKKGEAPDTYEYTYPSGAKFNIHRNETNGNKNISLENGKIVYWGQDWDKADTISMISAGDNVDISNSILTAEFVLYQTLQNANYRTKMVIGDGTNYESILSVASMTYYTYGEATVNIKSVNKGGKSAVTATLTYYTDAAKNTATVSNTVFCNYTVSHLGFDSEAYSTNRVLHLLSVSLKKQDSYLKYNPMLNQFPSGGGSAGTLIQTEETVTSSDGKAFIKVSAFNNTGTQPATWNKYDGEKIYLSTPNYDYKGDANISFGWAKGTKDIKYVEFTLSQINRADNLQISATRRSTQGEVLGNIAFIWYKGNADGFIVETAPAGKSYNVRIESDPRTGKVYTYINDILAGETSGELIGDEEMLNIAILTPGAQNVQFENVSVGTAELCGGTISDITLSEDGKSAFVKTFNPVYHGVGYFANELCLFLADYEGTRLSDMSVFDAKVPARGRRTFTAEFEEGVDLTNTKAMLWDITNMVPLKEFKEWKKVSE